MDNSPRAQFKTLQIIHLALTAGPAFMFGILWLNQMPEINLNPMEGALGLILPFVVLGAIVLGKLLAKNLKSTLTKPNLANKLNNYRTAGIMRWALIEGAAMMSAIIFFFIESNVMALLSFAFGLWVLSSLRPTVDGFATLYNLSNQERSELT